MARQAARRGPFEIAGERIPAGKFRRLELPVGRLPTRTQIAIPLTVLHGKNDGPVLWLSAAIHGDELNGIEIIRRVLGRLKAREISGTVLAAPVVNAFGYIAQSRALPDGRDLNRSFPGSARGSLAARLAHLFMTEIVRRCQYGVDLHTAGHHRANLPQVRANLDDPETARLAEAFGAPVRIHSALRDGSLRQAASRLGIPILLYEGGEAQRFDETAISTGVDGVLRVLAALGIFHGEIRTAGPSPIARKSTWVRASRAGLCHLDVDLGARVGKGQRLGEITDTFGDERFAIKSPREGLVVGITRNPVVVRGDALVHLAAVE